MAPAQEVGIGDKVRISLTGRKASARVTVRPGASSHAMRMDQAPDLDAVLSPRGCSTKSEEGTAMACDQRQLMRAPSFGRTCNAANGEDGTEGGLASVHEAAPWNQHQRTRTW